MDSNDRLWILMGRSLSGEIGAEEQRELNELLLDERELGHQYSMLKKLWRKEIPQYSIIEEQISEKTLFNRIINKAETERQNQAESSKPVTFTSRFFSTRLILAYAASIALIATLFFKTKISEPHAADSQVIAAEYGSRSKVLLPDGTTVWLNGGSKLRYDYDFSGSTREVRLEGEAFFDVAKQKDRPFIVHAGNIDIKVHGTAFNVKCYQDEKSIETTLLHGKIEVTDRANKTKPSVFLTPNQKLIIPVAEPLQEVKQQSGKQYKLVNLDARLLEKERIETAWMYNRIEFRGEHFEDLAKKLERWYNVAIRFEDDSVKSLTFNGSFEKETVEQAFNALQKVGTFNYKIQGREISIKSPD